MTLYLSSYEYPDFDIPRTVNHFERMQLDGREVLAIEVEQPLIGQKYGWFDKDITTFYLVNRFEEGAFERLQQFPIDVQVYVMKSSTTILPHSLDELQQIAWACLNNNEGEARDHRMA
jgi:hypothetical protein